MSSFGQDVPLGGGRRLCTMERRTVGGVYDVAEMRVVMSSYNLEIVNVVTTLDLLFV
jgi:hypothetical protein